MYDDDPIFESQDHHLIAWVGTLTPAQLDAYLDEPGDRADDEPYSDFMRDLGRWCDHDFVWAESSEQPLDIGSLARNNGIDDPALIDELSARVAPHATWKCLIILWNSRLIDSRSRPRDLDGGNLVCIGSWEHESPLTD